MTKKKFLIWLVILIWFILICDLIALRYFLFWRFWWFDIVMHFLGGFWLVLLCYYLLFFSNLKNKLILIKEKYSVLIISFSFVVGIGILWELYELVFAFPLKNGYLFDTILDLVMDMLGWGIAYYFVLKKL